MGRQAFEKWDVSTGRKNRGKSMVMRPMEEVSGFLATGSIQAVGIRCALAVSSGFLPVFVTAMVSNIETRSLEYDTDILLMSRLTGLPHLGQRERGSSDMR